jgi:hypothetical protein
MDQPSNTQVVQPAPTQPAQVAQVQSAPVSNEELFKPESDEVLIEDETRKGEGLNSKNADIRQIFVELQNIVDDMKNAL